MFFRDLKPKTDVTLDVTLAEVYLPVKLGHRDAAAIFGEPLSQQLAATALGVVTACRARERSTGEVIGVDIFLGLRDTSEKTLKTVARMLERLSAPCGSSIRLTDGGRDPVVFGLTEGLELSVETLIAPDQDSRRDLVRACRDAMSDIAVSRGWTRQNDRTLFYFYGESYVAMRDSLLRILESHPRFAGAALRRMA